MSSKLDIVGRLTYRSLLKLGRRFDDNPILKTLICRAQKLPEPLDSVVATYLGGLERSYFWPSATLPQSVVDMIKVAFRYPPDEPNIEGGFQGLRYLTSLYNVANKHEIIERAKALEAVGNEQQQQLEEDALVTGQPKPGSLLIAHPLLGQWFSNSVVVLCQQTPSGGAYGLTLNKPLASTVGGFVDRMQTSIQQGDDGPFGTMPHFITPGAQSPDIEAVIEAAATMAESLSNADMTEEDLEELHAVMNAVLARDGDDDEEEDGPIITIVPSSSSSRSSIPIEMASSGISPSSSSLGGGRSGNSRGGSHDQISSDDDGSSSDSDNDAENDDDEEQAIASLSDKEDSDSSSEDEGGLGMGSGQPRPANGLQKLMELFNNSPLFRGGPVPGAQLLHCKPELGGHKVVDDVHVGADTEGLAKVEAMRQDGTLKDKDVKLFIGDTGWAPMQLEAELDSGAWVMIKPREFDAFAEEYMPIKGNPTEAFERDMWEKMMKKSGYSTMAAIPAAACEDILDITV